MALTRYAEVHKTTKGPGDARPTALQIIADNNIKDKWADKTILITGCSSGIGIETARAMAATGARLFCTARDLSKGQEALKDILKPGQVDLLELDLSSLSSVRTCAQEYLSKNDKLNILICNAGIMALPSRELTAEGHEMQFGTNHLGHFLLFQLLKPTLLRSAQPSFASRVVCVASSGHHGSSVHFDDLTLGGEGVYKPFVGYGQAKTSNIYMANEIDRRYGPDGIHGYSLHPGGIWTGLQKHMDTSKHRGNPESEKTMKNTEQGAATTVWAAVGEEWEGKGGKYLEDCQISPPGGEEAWPGVRGHAKWVYDEDQWKELWGVSCKLVGVEDD